MQETYKIGEVAAKLNLKTYVLRFWETEFPQIEPLRTEKGQRLYNKEHVGILRRIRHLLHERGLTIDGARKVLMEEAGRGVTYAEDGSYFAVKHWSNAQGEQYSNMYAMQSSEEQVADGLNADTQSMDKQEVEAEDFILDDVPANEEFILEPAPTLPADEDFILEPAPKNTAKNSGAFSIIHLTLPGCPSSPALPQITPACPPCVTLPEPISYLESNSAQKNKQALFLKSICVELEQVKNILKNNIQNAPKP